MDHDSLRTASTYINNLLLARGSLRNGEPIDFVKPSKESRAQIINLVHDLILREDRDREQREHVAMALRDVRADQTRKTAEIAQFREKQEMSARATIQAQAGERSARAEIKTLERTLKSAQEQIAKLKSSIAQVKLQCTNDVRKRDLELTRLKTHLQVQQRGSRTVATAPSMTITRGSRGRPTLQPALSPAQGLADPGYSLKQETTEFLTQLSQSLSDENDGLIALVRSSLDTVNALLGSGSDEVQGHDSAIGSLNGSENKNSSADLMHTLPVTYETLARDTGLAMAQLKSVLTNPSFVNIEEVQVRDEEIVRLRQGWEHMEQRWKDVLIMMDGWLKRINTGQSIDVEDLRRGMGLVSPGPFSRPPGRLSLASIETSLVDSDVSEIKLPDSDADESSLVIEPPDLLSPVGRALTRQMAGRNARRPQHALEPPSNFDLRPAKGVTRQGHGEMDFDAEVSDNDDDDEAPVLTIEEKLHVAQAEAEMASAIKPPTISSLSSRSKETLSNPNLEASDQNRQRMKPTGVASTSKQTDFARAVEKDDTLGQLPGPTMRRAKVAGRARKRKSTLSPDELEQLLNQTADQEGF